MSTDHQIHQNDVGTRLQGQIVDTDANGDEVVVDVSQASVLTMKFRKPSGAVVQKTAALVSDGTDGWIQYVTENGFLDEAGDWILQGFATIGSWTGHSSRETFPVARNVD